MIDIEPLIQEAQQAKAAGCFANVDADVLIQACAELKALRAENASLRCGQFASQSPGQTAPCQSRAYCYYNVSAGITKSP